MPQCGCKTVCFDQEFPGLPPQGDCRLYHPRKNVNGGRDSMNDDMIPRITVRDPDDALLIIQALRTHQYARSDALELEARRPGADQIALSLQHIDETKYVIDLMTAITDGIIPVTTESEEN